MGDGEKRAAEGYEEIAEALIRGRQTDVRGRKKKGGVGGIKKMAKIKSSAASLTTLKDTNMSDGADGCRRAEGTREDGGKGRCGRKGSEVR